MALVDARMPAVPSLPLGPVQYDKKFMDQFANVLRLYFNQLNYVVDQLVANQGPYEVGFYGGAIDAFGRARFSEPYTLFDSQNRFAADDQFDTSTATGGSTTYQANESTVDLNVTTSSGSEVVRQTYRSMPYQPGKSLQVMATFVMNAGKENLRQRVGYFNTENGVFFQQNGTTKSFVLRTYTSGTASDTRTVNQADWNGDKLDGTGDSGYTLDITKAQIFFADFEWLGVGSVRCGFVINGRFVICHTFNNANDINKVYMTTAILPVRYEITNTGVTASSSTMKQICSTVVSEGGYQQQVKQQIARRTTALATIGTTLLPLVSIRLKSTRLGAIVLPQLMSVFPTSAGNYEIQLVKNTTLTGASWVTSGFNNVEYDITATAMSGGTTVQVEYSSATNQSGGSSTGDTGYNFDLQLGASLAGVSDIYTIGVRVLSGTGDAIGGLAFIDLTD
ncbi:MAG: Cyanophage [Bacteroidota bacterium]|jgi:hypothetical protein